MEQEIKAPVSKRPAMPEIKLVTLCMACRKTCMDGKWDFHNLAYTQRISHGYCPECGERLLAELDAELEEQLKAPKF